jgi:hypothetical protein
MREGNVAAARAALTAAKDAATGLSEREASHIAFFDLLFTGRTDAAIAAFYTHLTAWPRDVLVVASGANPNGLIGGSGHTAPTTVWLTRDIIGVYLVAVFEHGQSASADLWSPGWRGSIGLMRPAVDDG